MADEEKKEPTANPEKETEANRNARIAIAIILIVIALGGIAAFGAGAFHQRAGRFDRNIEFVGRPMMAERDGRGFGRGRMMRNVDRAGVTGVVTAINGNNLTVKDSNGKETTVVVSDGTSYVKAGEIAKQSDLSTNNVVSVRGGTNSQGQITATIIQIW